MLKRGSWLLLVVPLLLIAVVTASAGEMMSVQVKNGQVRASPTFLGKIVATLAYGDRVETVGEQGEWMKVKTSKGQTGWIHSSALTEKKIVLASGSKDVQTAASGEELALAGKGFNSDVEAEFKAKNKDVDFTWVDRMEKIVILPTEMETFLKAGEVKPAAGGGI